MTAIPKDKSLYDKIKSDVYKANPINSAYRSAIIIKKYKEAYYNKYKSKDAYEGKKNKNSGIVRWLSEKWLNQRGEIGYKKQGDIYRPTIRVTKETPITFSELTSQQIKKAMKEKKEQGRVKNFLKL